MRHVVMTVMAILLAGGGNIEGVGGDISNRGPNKIRLTLPADWVDNLRGLQGSYVMCGGSEGALTLKTLLREGGVTFVEKRALGQDNSDSRDICLSQTLIPPTLITLYTHESLSNLSCDKGTTLLTARAPCTSPGTKDSVEVTQAAAAGRRRRTGSRRSGSRKTGESGGMRGPAATTGATSTTAATGLGPGPAWGWRRQLTTPRLST